MFFLLKESAIRLNFHKIKNLNKDYEHNYNFRQFKIQLLIILPDEDLDQIVQASLLTINGKGKCGPGKFGKTT